jgi:uncharacterized membrane protein HdeD (DUF308 family)
MKNRIFNNWSFPRIIRLIIGIIIIIDAIYSKDVLIGVLGLFFTSMAVFSLGGCYSPTKNGLGSAENVNYDEVH